MFKSYIVVPEKDAFPLKSAIELTFEVRLGHVRTDKFGYMIKISPQQPAEKRQKESSEKLSQVKTTTGQNRIDAITVFSLQIIALQSMI